MHDFCRRELFLLEVLVEPIGHCRHILVDSREVVAESGAREEFCSDTDRLEFRNEQLGVTTHVLYRRWRVGL